ncbi:hypothetical protein SELMODRAFT_89585, partial [Selaginella moellendorffii]
SSTAEKSRQIVGEERSSQSGKFSWMDCFDLGSGTLACSIKEGVKLYTYNIRSGIVEKSRHKAYEIALEDALHEGLSIQEASRAAAVAGKKAAKISSRKARRITGPVIAAAWDFFEAIYYGGGPIEATMRGAGTMCGAWMGGIEGERKLGRIGYLIGSHLGNWIGGRVGLMLYDIGNAAWFLKEQATAMLGGGITVEEESAVEVEL